MYWGHRGGLDSLGAAMIGRDLGTPVLLLTRRRLTR